ncbi:MAG: hypothetical protein L0241_28485, partial [Planctomycetia bacterium]|nr:hypothetical protein [Planctomycetia bacterium]
MARRSALSLVVLVLALAIGCNKKSGPTPSSTGDPKPQKQDPSAVQKALAGAWRVTTIESSGQKPESSTNKTEITFDDKSMTVKWEAG